MAEPVGEITMPRLVVEFDSLMKMLMGAGKIAECRQRIGVGNRDHRHRMLLGLSGGYSAGWVVCAVPAVLVGVNMFRQGKPVQQRNAL